MIDPRQKWGDYHPARLDPFLRQQVPQHPSARCPAEYCAAMPERGQKEAPFAAYRSVASASDRRPRPGAAGNDAATADAQHAGRAADAELRCAIDHRFARHSRASKHAPPRNRAALPSAPDNKIRLRRQLPDLRMQGLHVDDRLRLRFWRGPEHACGAFKTLITPLLDLVGVSGTQTCPAGFGRTSKS